MKAIILIAALIGNKGSSQITLPFNSMDDCTRVAMEYKITMQKDGAPGWSGDSGIIVKTMCVEVKK